MKDSRRPHIEDFRLQDKQQKMKMPRQDLQTMQEKLHQMHSASGLRAEKQSHDNLRGGECNKKQNGSRNNSQMNLLADYKDQLHHDQSRNSSANSANNLRIKSGKKFTEDANKVKRRVYHAPLPTLKKLAKENKKLNKLLKVHINVSFPGPSSNN